MFEVILVEDDVHSVDLAWLECSDSLTTVHLISIGKQISRVICTITDLLNKVEQVSWRRSVVAEEVVSNVYIYAWI